MCEATVAWIHREHCVSDRQPPVPMPEFNHTVLFNITLAYFNYTCHQGPSLIKRVSVIYLNLPSALVILSLVLVIKYPDDSNIVEGLLILGHNSRSHSLTAGKLS